ncbi:MAG TPA: hypothetical protein DCR20_07030, partial [Planctomycetaceae bacterium]|nr:hypothetical protein [Planctomycetaceae bacterium]
MCGDPLGESEGPRDPAADYSSKAGDKIGSLGLGRRFSRDSVEFSAGQPFRFPRFSTAGIVQGESCVLQSHLTCSSGSPPVKPNPCDCSAASPSVDRRSFVKGMAAAAAIVLPGRVLQAGLYSGPSRTSAAETA